MNEDLSVFSNEDRRRIARTAKRRVGSEAVLILTAGFSFLMVAMFFGGKFTFLPVAEATGIRPTIIWVGASFALSAIWAWLHVSILRPKVTRAQKLDAAFIHEYEDTRRMEREEKLKAFKDDE